MLSGFLEWNLRARLFGSKMALVDGEGPCASDFSSETAIASRSDSLTSRIVHESGSDPELMATVLVERQSVDEEWVSDRALAHEEVSASQWVPADRESQCGLAFAAGLEVEADRERLQGVRVSNWPVRAPLKGS